MKLNVAGELQEHTSSEDNSASYQSAENDTSSEDNSARYQSAVNDEDYAPPTSVHSHMLQQPAAGIEHKNWRQLDAVPTPRYCAASARDYKFDSDSDDETPIRTIRSRRLDLGKMGQSIQDGEHVLKEAKDQNVVVVLGKTGVGKSTFIQAILQPCASCHVPCTEC